MTTPNFKSFALAIAALFTFALTSCEKNEIANLTPYEVNEIKSTGLVLDPHELIEDENMITKPYNNLGKPYRDFIMATEGNTGVPVPKPPRPVYSDSETRRVADNTVKPTFTHDDEKIARKDTGPLYTEAEVRISPIDNPAFSDDSKPGKPTGGKPFNEFTDLTKPVKPSGPVFTDAELKIRQLNLINGTTHGNGSTLVDRDGYEIK